MKNRDYRLLSNQFSKKTFSLDLRRKKNLFSIDDKKSRTDLGNNNRERQTKINAVQTWFPRLIMIKVVSSIYIVAKVRPKPSLKIRTASAIFWNYLGIFRDHGLNHISFRNKTFLFFKMESWNFQHLFDFWFQLIQFLLSWVIKGWWRRFG